MARHRFLRGELVRARSRVHVWDRDLAEACDAVGVGSLSSLGALLGEKHAFDDDVYEKEWTTAYHRDRGDELAIAEYDDMYSISGAYEFMYVYMNQSQWMYKNDSANSPWLPLI